MQAVSSANRDVKQSMLSGRSFISIMKRSGPRIVPCGIPHWSVNGSERVSRYEVEWLLSLR